MVFLKPRMISPPGRLASTLGFSVAAGYMAGGLKGWTLLRHGYDQVSVVTGSDLADAERRYLESTGPSAP